MEDFEQARERGLARLHDRQGIGTLGERSLHCIMKYLIDSDENHHEVKLGLGRLVADVFDGQHVYEIQTRSFNQLAPKLERILPIYPVTVVLPITRVKQLIWVNPESGETSKPRRSPKIGRVWDAFKELYRIRRQLCNDKLNIKLIFLDFEEYRLKDGWARDGKRGSHRMERIPFAVGDVVELKNSKDYKKLLPSGLTIPFTSADLAGHIKISRKRAGEICNVMYNMHAIIRRGKIGNAYLYEIT